MKKNEYLEYLKMNNLSESTAKTYYKRLKFYQKNNVSNHSKEYIGQTKNALKYYFKAQDIYFHENISKLNNMQKNKPRSKPVKAVTKISTVNKKINALKNKRIKLAFRLQQLTGLRIGEIAQLKKSDLTFKDGKIFVLVRESKNNKSRRVSTIIKDKWLYDKLLELEERKDILFYKESTLRVKAWKLGFKSHKLRKVTAKTINLRYSAKNESEKKEIIRKFLGHGNDRTLKIYIDENDKEIDLSNTKFDI